MLFTIIFIIAFCLFLAIVVWSFISVIKNPDSMLFSLIWDWKFRMLREIRRQYLKGLNCEPPTGYEFFYNRALDYINNETNIKKPLLERQDIANMLAYEGFIYHYFVELGEFTVPVYRKMCQDYRTGEYSTNDYPSQDKLKKIVPVELSSSEGAFSDFWKFVNAGWFDRNTGMYILTETKIAEDGTQDSETVTRNHQHIGRAIYWICKRNGIPCPERVFANLWNTPAKTIKEWLRINENEEITKAIDKIVSSILTK